MTVVLCVRLSAMGDVVQSLGAVRALHAARPDLRLVFLTQRELAPLLAGVDGIETVVAHDRRGGLAALWRTRRRLRGLGCEVALDLQGNGKSALLAWLSGARQRLGAGARWRQEPWSRCWLSRTVLVPGPRHPALVAVAIVRELAPAAALLPPRLSASADELDAVRARLLALGIDAARPFTLVVVGRADDPRSLQPATIAAEIARGGPVLLLAGPRERDVEVPRGAPVWRQQAGDLRLLVALGALLAQGGGEAVGPDQGPVHVLAGAGARTTVLFGPQDPACTAPPGARVLQHGSPPPCMPCRARACRHPDGPVCMAFRRADGRAVPPPGWLVGDAP